MSSTSILLLAQVQPVVHHAWLQKLDSELHSSVVIRAISSTVMRHLNGSFAGYGVSFAHCVTPNGIRELAKEMARS